MAGEEMTNWFYGHATVSGITPGDWFDWRQLPGGELTASPDPRSGSIQQFVEAATASGAYVSVATPSGRRWSGASSPRPRPIPAARTQGLEVWTGQFQPDDEASLATWDSMLVQGQRIVANGGSDLHGTENDQGFASGRPTTVVHADALSKRAVVDGAQGRPQLRHPAARRRRVCTLTATALDGQRQWSAHGTGANGRVEVEVLARAHARRGADGARR
jgi:hypothetical protein